MRVHPTVLTPGRCSRLSGAAVVITNDLEGYGYEGTVDTVAVAGDELRIRFRELRQTKGDHDGEPRLDFAASFHIYALSFVGETVVLESPVVNETVVFTPADGVTVNPLHDQIGGDVELNEGGGMPKKSTRGPLKSLRFEGSRVFVTCEWRATADLRSDDMRHKLIAENEFDRDLAELELVGGGPDSLGRFVFVSAARGESVVFFSPSGKKLSRDKVVQ